MRWALLALNGAAFQWVYSACNLAAQRAQVTRNVATAWDVQWPFVPWLVLPYLTSVPLLMLGFALAPDRSGLHAYSQRLLLTTSLGCLTFALWPLRFQGARPLPGEPLWAEIFGLLHRLDAPFNQFPSLHVAFMVVLWPTLRAGLPQRWQRGVAALWLALVAVSTVFTHQHHLADVPGGLLLGALALWLAPVQRPGPAVAFHYAMSAVLAMVLAITSASAFGAVLCVWLALCAAAVAWAYYCGNAQFLHKRDGQFPLWVWALYGPYLAAYVLTWWLVRWRERRRPPVYQPSPQLWVGRRLSRHEAAAHLPAGCSVVDLANELTETPALRLGRYHAVAWLDLQPPPAAALQSVLRHIHDELAAGRSVFIHCAMGYSRSHAVTRAVMEISPPP